MSSCKHIQIRSMREMIIISKLSFPFTRAWHIKIYINLHHNTRFWQANAIKANALSRTLWLKTNRLHCANFKWLCNIILHQCWTTLSSLVSLKSKQAVQCCEVKWFLCRDSGTICGLLVLNVKPWRLCHRNESEGAAPQPSSWVD